ncbi:hypothetical protein BDK51DRAFT_32837 [Blyttiomyces helicus]|uniref:CTLH domain-containing protein n=1 Tax=Blyttiomyces helicus TaxID=388810 RepID=A0A4P9W6G3_9FUNG|nr:hypothetical protein BDK51DRAFT_32837 [Blyttiomyces helicus]|eukprot:RKO86955.1 hypothetical protein BDK51DRAFT_32837 [Blyttiomyces helicus]
MVQSLQDLGFSNSATELQRESGYQLESSAVSKFRYGVLHGEWEAVERLLPMMNIHPKDMRNARFLIKEQKFLELLEAEKIDVALQVLRNELTPVTHQPERLHGLSSYLMCPNPEDLKQAAGWDGARGDSRHKLLADLQSMRASS